MRNLGTCYELVRTRSHDHIGWVYSSGADFLDLAMQFLSPGVQLRERMMLVVEDPESEALRPLRTALRASGVQVSSVADVYGPSGLVDPHQQEAVFTTELTKARADGYSGIRVVADNTPLVLDDAQMAAWVKWEIVADRFIAGHGVVGLCAFDANRVDVDRLRHLSTLHPLSSASCPKPQYRMYADGDALRLEGDVDATAVENLHKAMGFFPSETSIEIDLGDTSFVTRSLLNRLVNLGSSGWDVVVRASQAVLDRFSNIEVAQSGALRWELAPDPVLG